MSYRVNLIGPRSSYGIPGSVTPVTPTALPTATKTILGSDHPFSGYTVTGTTPTIVGSALQFGPDTSISKATSEVGRPFTLAISVEMNQGDAFQFYNSNIVTLLDFTQASGYLFGNQDVFGDTPYYSDLSPGGRQIIVMAFDGTNIISMYRNYATQVCVTTPPTGNGVGFVASSGSPLLYEARFYNSWIGTTPALRVMESLSA